MEVLAGALEEVAGGLKVGGFWIGLGLFLGFSWLVG